MPNGEESSNRLSVRLEFICRAPRRGAEESGLAKDTSEPSKCFAAAKWLAVVTCVRRARVVVVVGCTRTIQLAQRNGTAGALSDVGFATQCV